VVEALSESPIRPNDLETWEFRIDKEADIVVVRQRTRDLAKEHRFDQFAVAALTTAASELSRNVWVHAKQGKARITVLRAARRIGLELEFVDQGPGIADLNRALAGGYSTANSLGLGLSGTRRLVDEFSIDTEAGRGTTIVIRKWKRDF
jgi:serine/threonine-protein kinase RsbT